MLSALSKRSAKPSLMTCDGFNETCAKSIRRFGPLGQADAEVRLNWPAIFNRSTLRCLR